MSFDRYHSEAEDRNGPTLTAMVSAAREVIFCIPAALSKREEGSITTRAIFSLRKENSGQLPENSSFRLQLPRDPAACPPISHRSWIHPWLRSDWQPVLTFASPSYSAGWWNRAPRCFWSVRLGRIRDWSTGSCSTVSGHWKTSAT